MVKKIYEHITMENAKEFFFDNQCRYELMDWILHDEFECLNISEEVRNSWNDEYYENRYPEYLEKKEKSSDMYRIIVDFSNTLSYSVIKKYYEAFTRSYESELPNKKFLILSFLFKSFKHHIDKTPEFSGMVLIALKNNDLETMNDAIDLTISLLKRYYLEGDISKDRINRMVKGLIDFSKKYELDLDEKIKELEEIIV